MYLFDDAVIKVDEPLVEIRVYAQAKMNCAILKSATGLSRSKELTTTLPKVWLMNKNLEQKIEKPRWGELLKLYGVGPTTVWYLLFDCHGGGFGNGVFGKGE